MNDGRIIGSPISAIISKHYLQNLDDKIQNVGYRGISCLRRTFFQNLLYTLSL